MWPSEVANTSDGAEVCTRLPVPTRSDSRRALFDQMRTEYGQRRAKQGGLNFLALAGLLLCMRAASTPKAASTAVV